MTTITQPFNDTFVKHIQNSSLNKVCLILSRLYCKPNENLTRLTLFVATQYLKSVWESVSPLHLMNMRLSTKTSYHNSNFH